MTTYGYEIRGNRTTLTDAMGYTWGYQYDLVDAFSTAFLKSRILQIDQVSFNDRMECS